MKENDVIALVINNVNVTSVVIKEINSYNDENVSRKTFLCYGQNRLFSYIETKKRTEVVLLNQYDEFIDVKFEFSTSYEFGKTLIEYVVLPEYDNMIAEYYT